MSQFFQSGGGGSFSNSDITGQTEDTAPAMDDFLVTSDTGAGALKKVTFANAKKDPVTAVKTADYTLSAAADRVVLGSASGGAFAFTLPTAVGNTGVVFTMIKTTASTAKITINTTSSQTIGTYASAALALDFLNERLTVISDGSNWQILDWGYPEVHYTLSVTGDNTWSTDLATAVVRKTINQSWRLAMNIKGTTASTANETITIADVTFLNNHAQTLCGQAQGGSGVDGRCKTVVNTGQITINTSAVATAYGVMGEVKLEGKPGFSI